MTPEQPSLTMDDLREELKALFAAFLPRETADRFASLLDLEPRRWSKIDPWAVWGVKSSRIVAWPRGLMFAQVHQWPAMAAMSNRSVAVLRCGHSSPSLSREPLADIFSGQSDILDGFVSVERGKLGLALNHSGGIRILTAVPLTFPPSAVG